MPDPRRRISTLTLDSMEQKSDSIFLPILLDITHPSIVWDGISDVQQDGHLRLVNDVRGIRYKGDDLEPHYYAPCNFTIKMPKEDGKNKSSATASISTVDGRAIEVIRSVDEDLNCQVIAFYAKIKNENDTVQYVFSKLYGKKFQMGGVTWTDTSAEWELDPDKIMDLNMPRDKGSMFRFPAITR
jgi:hypothetical protein